MEPFNTCDFTFNRALSGREEKTFTWDALLRKKERKRNSKTHSISWETDWELMNINSRAESDKSVLCLRRISNVFPVVAARIADWCDYHDEKRKRKPFGYLGHDF